MTERGGALDDMKRVKKKLDIWGLMWQRDRAYMFSLDSSHRGPKL